MATTTTNPTQFAFFLRILHWLMAACLLAMLFIGVSMVASLGNYHWLLAIHRPLGISILILALLRLVTRLTNRTPALPPTVPPSERMIMKLSEFAMYALFIALPLVGWAMLSAGHYPIVMFGSVHLPPILAPRPEVYATLRKTHTVLAYALFLVFLAHMSGVLFHTWIVRDHFLSRMLPWTVRAAKSENRG